MVVWRGEERRAWWGDVRKGRGRVVWPDHVTVECSCEVLPGTTRTRTHFVGL